MVLKQICIKYINNISYTYIIYKVVKTNCTLEEEEGEEEEMNCMRIQCIFNRFITQLEKRGSV